MTIYRMLKLALALLLTSLLMACQKQSPSSTTDLPSAKPEQVGITDAKLVEIDRLIEKAIADQIVPGTVVLVGKDGKVV